MQAKQSQFHPLPLPDARELTACSASHVVSQGALDVLQVHRHTYQD